MSIYMTQIKYFLSAVTTNNNIRSYTVLQYFFSSKMIKHQPLKIGQNLPFPNFAYLIQTTIGDKHQKPTSCFFVYGLGED